MSILNSRTASCICLLLWMNLWIELFDIKHSHSEWQFWNFWQMTNLQYEILTICEPQKCFMNFVGICWGHNEIQIALIFSSILNTCSFYYLWIIKWIILVIWMDEQVSLIINLVYRFMDYGVSFKIRIINRIYSVCQQIKQTCRVIWWDPVLLLFKSW